MPITHLFATGLISALTWTGGGQEASDSKLQKKKATEWFAHQPAPVQNKILRNVRDAVAKSGDPFLASTRDFVVAASAQKRIEYKTQQKISPDGSFPLGRELPFPLFKEYVFGARTVRDVETGKGGVVPDRAAEMAALLDGMPPDLDLALARVLAELDQDKSADEFGLFLESWRNGDESFYRALDRTAGTSKEVFYYDVMLNEFNARFTKNEELIKFPKSKKGLQQVHDELHAAFLTYRQYRALREATALSLLLPVQWALPKNLKRYEEKPEGPGQLSTRDELQILLHYNKFDLRRTIADFCAASPSMPSPLWSGNYDPVSPFLGMFTKRAGELYGSAGSPEAALKLYRDARDASAKAVVRATEIALRDAGCAAYKDAHH